MIIAYCILLYNTKNTFSKNILLGFKQNFHSNFIEIT